MSAKSVAGRLRVVATPIGNMGDITLRALDALREADAIAAEDTRVTGKLLARYDIATRMERFDEHVAAARTPLLVQRMLDGETIALVSDAGTPGVSDPGSRLVEAAVEAGVDVEAIPGASALLAATVASGLPMRRIYFGGFLSRKAGERARELAALAELDATLVFYESPKRAAATLASIAGALPGRRAVLARELTKLHEEIVRAEVTELAAAIAERDALKGEVVLLVGPPTAESEMAAAPADDAIRARLAELEDAGARRSEAVKQAAAEFGVSRKHVYAIALER